MRPPQLDPQQQAAVDAPRGPVCVLAGAGTGKTRTITHRIARLVTQGHVSAGQVLAVTFTARAAGEMRTRLRSMDVHGPGNSVQALTFHAAALRQLRYFWPQAVGSTRWELLDNKFPVVARAARRAGVGTATETLRDLASEIEWAKASLISPDRYPEAAARLQRDTPVEAVKVADVFRAYEALKTDADGDMLLDFDDLILLTTEILSEHSAVAEEFRDRYRCFVVDEYQDVTPAQQQLLDAWLGRRDDITVVGDANQTIYSFAGAQANYLLDFSRRFPDAAVVRLERDYRSTPQVVGLANRVIGAARGRAAGTRLELIGQRPPGPEPQFAEYDDEPAEAKAVAAGVARLIERGVEPSEIAILYRINAQSEAHEQALTEAGIPYQVRGGEAFFSRTEIRQAMRAITQTAERGGEVGDVVGAVRTLLVGLGMTEAEPSGAQARARWESLRSLATLTEEMYAENPMLTFAGLADELRKRSEARHPPTVQGVTLSSLHAAKGLEWDAVFLVGATEGSIPIAQSFKDERAVEEERRLLYVGITRARVHLHISWALARNEGGKKTRRRSRFLASLVPDDSPARAIVEPTRKRTERVCRICGAPLRDKTALLLGRCEDCETDINEDLFLALKAWRTRQASEQKVPPYVVFTDNTLLAIAEQEPTDVKSLVAIAGIGAKKLDQYGQDVLDLVRGSR
ncbi:ATP-dependent DNA helicase UvrD2 [Gordonia jinhuaensis]|uniref:DNA 3'-5' helicase n=1 Tax=Gordonia jinhuaensis TaxID=1517702 RepID=A0A916TIA4_9ACTN|nr:ATP-dependent DNA helicase UvrD2 [Gordonia jinhuaensis]GGB45262.1 DNA helicase [Gordonia jinhuaensis]